jgi:hypothetical protein
VDITVEYHHSSLPLFHYVLSFSFFSPTINGTRANLLAEILKVIVNYYFRKSINKLLWYICILRQIFLYQFILFYPVYRFLNYYCCVVKLLAVVKPIHLFYIKPVYL